MSFSVECPHCGASFRVSNRFAGRRARCSMCRQVLVLPDAPESVSDETSGSGAAEPEPQAVPRAEPPPLPPVPPPPPADWPRRPSAKRAQPKKGLDAETLVRAFRGDVKKPAVAGGYQVWVTLTALVMVLLPLVYVGMIVLIAAGICYHLVWSAPLAREMADQAIVMSMILYILPVLVGSTLIVFMIKPLFAPPAKPTKRRVLTRQQEPLLFLFVDTICTKVGAPKPKEIYVATDVNAAAGFHRGFAGWYAGELDLMIGLPLVAGLDMRQFAGVLAHEFGHFSQRVGMRLSYMIRSINYWFMRVVYERDAWDEYLTRAAMGLDVRISWMLHLVRVGIWLTRKILWVLMMLGHLISSALMREMEYDADQYEIQLAGSKAFEETTRKLLLLNVAYEGALSDMYSFYMEGRLCDNLPKLIAANVDQVPKELMEVIRMRVDKAKTGFFDTHPSDRDRIAYARQMAAPGIFGVKHPASGLFRQFDTHCKSVTVDMYRAIFGKKFKPTDVYPTEALLRRQKQQKESAKAQERFFFGPFSVGRPIRLPKSYITAPKDVQQAIHDVRDLQQAMHAKARSYQEVVESLSDAHRDIALTAIAEACRVAKFKVSKKTFGFSVRDYVGIIRERRRRRDALGVLDRQAAEFEQLAGRRICLDHELLQSARVQGHLQAAEQMVADSRRLLPVLNTLASRVPAFWELSYEFSAMKMLCEHLDKCRNDPDFGHAMVEQMRKVRDALVSVTEGLHEVQYPLEHGQGTMSIAAYLGTCVTANDLGLLYQTADQLQDRFAQLYASVFARVAEIAQHVEDAVGIPPLQPVSHGASEDWL